MITSQIIDKTSDQQNSKKVSNSKLFQTYGSQNCQFKIFFRLFCCWALQSWKLYGKWREIFQKWTRKIFQLKTRKNVCELYIVRCVLSNLFVLMPYKAQFFRLNPAPFPYHYSQFVERTFFVPKAGKTFRRFFDLNSNHQQRHNPGPLNNYSMQDFERSHRKHDFLARLFA